MGSLGFLSGLVGLRIETAVKVLAVVLGSEGDMLPFAHLGVALRDRGHQFVFWLGLANSAGVFVQTGWTTSSYPVITGR